MDSRRDKYKPAGQKSGFTGRDLFTQALHAGGFLPQKERHVGAHGKRYVGKLGWGQRRRERGIEEIEQAGRITAATAKASSHGYAFVKLKHKARKLKPHFFHGLIAAHKAVVFPGNVTIVADDLQTLLRACVNGNAVVWLLQRIEKGVELMVAIGASACDFEPKVDLGFGKKRCRQSEFLKGQVLIGENADF